ncbi:MAG: Pilin/Flagellin PilA family [Candidatus Methanohalarchaeum thermophilum]|uniref:Pilin/Flagellin PilA family n=1 Tax=Methanohalarchaeum thermophilum TaxID=1903181 RepID=A0A1Q6DT44_METT1|nr:MAG: Pilin/Flagellin PilA family [Candidatus Methanohalarchaeum thermophilum]
MKIKPKLLKEKEGVSPVIGVILMVAITVIMAAIVAGFVFGVIQTPQATPTASITIDSISNSSGQMVLLHQSGDSLNVSDIDVIVTGLDNTTKTATKDLEEVVASSFDGSWDTGERVIISESDFGYGFTEGNDFEARIVHTPSGGTVSAPTATAQ